jgi:hypothetical protein
MAGVLLLCNTNPTPATIEVQKALDDRGIAYGITFVGNYADPRLQVGGGELVGREILNHLDKIQELSIKEGEA